jgi:hypothetical protein
VNNIGIAAKKNSSLRTISRSNHRKGLVCKIGQKGEKKSVDSPNRTGWILAFNQPLISL